MDKIKAFYRKYMSRITISMSKQPVIVTLLMLVVINLIIMLISSVLARAIAPEKYSSVVQAFAEGSLKWMISPYSILYLEGNAGLMILAGIVIIIEMVLFTGTIIAMTTNILRDYLVKRGDAKGKLILMNHILILNWNSKVPEILVDLMHKDENVSILVLSDKDKEFVRNQVQSAITEDIHKNKLDLIIRKGDPFTRSELDDVCVSEAKSVVIMAEERISTYQGDYSQVDINALKLLLLVGSFKLKSECNIVVEVEEHRTVCMLEDMSKTVEVLKGKQISSVSFNRKLGHILAQTVFHTSLASIYMDLLSFKGEEFYPTNNCDIDKYLAEYTNGIPIINHSKLYVLTSSAANLYAKRSKPYTTSRRLKKAVNNKKQKTNLYVFGKSRKKDYLLENLNRQVNSELFRYETFDQYSECVDIKKGKNERNIVLILSDDTVSKENYDANVFCTLINMRNQCDPSSVSLITEILDPRNVNSIKDFNVNNAIISNQLISFIIAQMASNAGSKEFYDDLLLLDKEGEEGFDIIIENAEDMLDLSEPLSFSTRSELVNSFYYTFDKKYMLIGLIKDGKTQYLSMDMDNDINIIIERKDQLIMIKY